MREQIVQIAVEGRKFGLWMLLSTQRRSKNQPNVISQCDNLVLMKMSSPADLAGLGSFFGFAPHDLLDAGGRQRHRGAAAGGGRLAPDRAVTRPRFREKPDRRGACYRVINHASM